MTHKKPSGLLLAAERKRRLEAYEAYRLTQPCKDQQSLCRSDGGCLRCDADAGERGRNCPSRQLGKVTP